MDVLVGPTFSIDVSSYGHQQPQDNHHHAGLYITQTGVVETRTKSEEGASSDSSSSIGAPDDSEDESKGDSGDGDGDGDEVESKFNGGGGGLGSLGSFGSLEESLPIKRGLSNYFSGKSKSFASLADVCTTVSSVKEVEKRDNPFNKRRRVLIASKWSRKSSSSSSLYNWPNPKSMPLLALNEDDDEDEDDHKEHEHGEQLEQQSSSDEKDVRSPKKLLDRRHKSFKSKSCYCLSDLQEHEQ